MHHLIRAQNANNQIVNVHTNSELENMSRIHSIDANTHMTIKHHIYFCSFLKALIIREIPEKNKKIPKIISRNFQNTLGAHMVMIPHKIRIHASHAINHTGHFCFCFDVLLCVIDVSIIRGRS